jgi:hypothetical protein
MFLSFSLFLRVQSLALNLRFAFKIAKHYIAVTDLIEYLPVSIVPF